MDQKLIQQIKEAEAKGWKLCVGCSLMKSDDANWSPCQTCPIETRKLMGYNKCSRAALQQFDAKLAGERIAVTRGNIGLEEYTRLVEGD